MGLIVFILKIILIVLLAVLGLFLLLAGLILLVPIRYEVKGILGDSGEIQVKGTVTYLLSMFKLLFFYEKEQFEMRVFIFGFQKKIQEEPILETPQDDGNKTNLKQEEVHNKEIISEKQEFSNKKKQTVEEESGISESMAKKSDASEMDEWKETNNKSEKDKKRKVRKKKTKQEKRRPDFSSIKLQLTDEHNKSVVKKICLEFLYLLRHFKFRKIITDLRFSTGEPAFTGQLLGILCMIPTLYRYDFKLVPDFEEEEAYIKGTFFLSGKVRLIHILITFLRLIFDKEVRLVHHKLNSVYSIW